MSLVKSTFDKVAPRSFFEMTKPDISGRSTWVHRSKSRLHRLPKCRIDEHEVSLNQVDYSQSQVHRKVSPSFVFAQLRFMAALQLLYP